MKCIAILLVVALARGQDTSTATSSGTSSTSSGGKYDLPPPPPPSGGGLPLGGLGGFGFPGLGFHKNLDFSAGYGLGGLGGGFGGLPIGGLGGLLGGGPPPDGDVPPPDGGFGGFPGFGGFGGFGPSYVPASWIGSALGAKGDLLFPIVIFIFFVVGVFFVVKLLLEFIVPLIAGKLLVKSSLLKKPFLKRDAPIDPQQVDLDFITNAVMDAINEPKCLKYVACHTGNFLNGMAGGSGDGKGSAVKSYEGILHALSKMAKSEALDVFEEAFVNGKDCTGPEFSCNEPSLQKAHNANATSNVDTHANEVN